MKLRKVSGIHLKKITYFQKYVTYIKRMLNNMIIKLNILFKMQNTQGVMFGKQKYGGSKKSGTPCNFILNYKPIGLYYEGHYFP